jgi:hypothetical protein
MTTELDYDEILKQVVGQIAPKHPQLLPSQVEGIARAELDKLWDQPVKDYLVVLTGRATKKAINKSDRG